MENEFYEVLQPPSSKEVIDRLFVNYFETNDRTKLLSLIIKNSLEPKTEIITVNSIDTERTTQGDRLVFTCLYKSNPNKYLTIYTNVDKSKPALVRFSRDDDI